MAATALGRPYQPGEVIIRQGEKGDCMYVVQSGTVTVVHEEEGRDVVLAELGEGEFIGEMSLFAKEVRSATVRAKGKVSVLTVDRRTLLSRIQKDPALAFRILEKMSSRIRDLDKKYGSLRASDRRDWDNRPEEYNRS